MISRERNPRRIGSGRIQIDRDREREPAHQERDFRAIRDRFDREDRRFDNRDNRNYGRREFEDRVRICILYHEKQQKLPIDQLHVVLL